MYVYEYVHRGYVCVSVHYVCDTTQRENEPLFARASNRALKELLGRGADTTARHGQGRLPLEAAHLRMLMCDYPLSQRIGETVRVTR